MRVEQLVKDYPIEVEWRPFELHPEIPLEGRPKGPPSGASSPVLAVAQAAGIPMVRTSVIPNSRPSLEAAEWVRATAPEAFSRFHAALFHAYFVEDRNIGDHGELVKLAETQGLDGPSLREALARRRYAPDVDSRMQWAVERGISSTPFFIFAADRLYGLPGAQEYPVFQSIMARLGVAPRTATDEQETSEP